jgi:hypothetical protein
MMFHRRGSAVIQYSRRLPLIALRLNLALPPVSVIFGGTGTPVASLSTLVGRSMKTFSPPIVQSRAPPVTPKKVRLLIGSYSIFWARIACL